jgi:hypothetical protein
MSEPSQRTPRRSGTRTRDPVTALRHVARAVARGAHGRSAASVTARFAELAAVALAALERGEPRAAVAPLSQLVLRLPRDHAVSAAAHAALAHVHCELGRPRRALVVAREAQRLQPRSALAEVVAARAYASLFPVVR